MEIKNFIGLILNGDGYCLTKKQGNDIIVDKIRMCFIMNKNLEKEIRCKCGKMYGLSNFRKKRICRRWKTPVIARGPVKPIIEDIKGY